MSGWIVITLLAAVPTLTALLVYAAERDLRRRQELARQSLAWLRVRNGREKDEESA